MPVAGSGWRSRIKSLLAFVLAAVALAAAAFLASLQYLDLPDQLGLMLAVASAAVVFAYGLWRETRARQPAADSGAPPASLEVVNIDPDADFDALVKLGIAPLPGLPDWRTAAPRPPYVVRQVDRDLRRALRDQRFVLLIGDSKAGKSRAAYEALAATFPGHKLIVPPRPGSDREALRTLVRSVPNRRFGPSPAFLWLDDLDEYLIAGALESSTLTALETQQPSLSLIATVRSSQYLTLAQSSRQIGDESLLPAREAARVLGRAEVVNLPSGWTEADVEAARSAFPTARFDPELGLGAFLVGGTQLAARMTFGAAQSPAGQAVTLAAVDARRAGVTRPLTRDELAELWTIYLPARPGTPTPSGQLFAEGLDWACEPTDAGVSLVHPSGDGYIAFDYAVALRSGERPGGPVASVPEALWDALLRTLKPSDLFSVGSAAYGAKVFDLAVPAYQEVIRAFSDATELELRQQVASALVNLAYVHAQMGDHASAIEASDEVVRRFGEATELELRQQVASALFRKGNALGDGDRAIAAYDEVVRRFGEATEPGLREDVALALVAKGASLALADNYAGAINAFDEVVRRYGDATEASLHFPVAMSLTLKGTVLAESGDRAAAINAFDEVVRRFGEKTEPELRERVATAVLYRGQALAESGDRTAAINAFDEVVRRSVDATEPELRLVVATALVNRGEALAKGGDHTRAIEAYDEVVHRFGEATELEMREQVATALEAKGEAAIDGGDRGAAIEAYDEVVDRFGEATEPDLRLVVATALVNRGEALAKGVDHTRAIEAYDEAVRRFGEAPEPELRLVVATALVNKGQATVGGSDPRAALEVFDEVVRRFGEATEPELGVPVATALVKRGLALAQIGDHASAIRAYDDVIRRFGGTSEPQLRELVAQARRALE